MTTSSILSLAFILISSGGGPIDIFSQFLQLIHVYTLQTTFLATTVILVVYRLIEVVTQFYRRKEKKEKVPIKITVEIDGAPITIETYDEDEAVQLVKRFQQLHPKVDNPTKYTARYPRRTTISARVPAKKKRL